MLSVEVGEFEDSPLHSPAYEEQVKVITSDVAKLNINWYHVKSWKRLFSAWLFSPQVINYPPGHLNVCCLILRN